MGGMFAFCIGFIATPVGQRESYKYVEYVLLDLLQVPADSYTETCMMKRSVCREGYIEREVYREGYIETGMQRKRYKSRGMQTCMKRLV